MAQNGLNIFPQSQAMKIRVVSVFLSWGLRWRGEQAVRSLMQSFLRMQDPLRIIRFGIEHPEGDGRGPMDQFRCHGEGCYMP